LEVDHGLVGGGIVGELRGGDCSDGSGAGAGRASVRPSSVGSLPRKAGCTAISARNVPATATGIGVSDRAAGGESDGGDAASDVVGSVRVARCRLVSESVLGPVRLIDLAYKIDRGVGAGRVVFSDAGTAEVRAHNEVCVLDCVDGVATGGRCVGECDGACRSARTRGGQDRDGAGEGVKELPATVDRNYVAVAISARSRARVVVYWRGDLSSCWRVQGSAELSGSDNRVT